MLATVVGKRLGRFKSKEDGREIEFARLYITYENDRVQGMAAEEVKISPAMLDGLEPGMMVDIIYNRYGRVDDVRPAD